jgi:hypothetical protein
MGFKFVKLTRQEKIWKKIFGRELRINFRKEKERERK